MNHRWQTPILIVLIVALLLAGLGARAKLVSAREAAGVAPVEFSSLPPVGAASIVLLGGFRGVAVDILWLQAITYHERRQYVEERGVIELVTQIQPHFVSVWAFWAMDIAYDISVQENDPRDQWPWIKDAVDFLNKGVALNPDRGDLLFYLGWIYTNKMSQNPYFEAACERDLGVNNYEEAARTFDRARRLPWGPGFVFTPRVVAGLVFYSWLNRAEQILRRAPLEADGAFGPATLAAIRPALDNATATAADLLRDPKFQDDGKPDAIFETFPARIELALSDGYSERVGRILADGKCSDAALAQARKTLDKCLREMDNARFKYSGPREAGIFRAKAVDAWLRIPHAVIQYAANRMDAPDVSPEVRDRSVQLIRIARGELDRIPRDLEDATEVASQKKFVNYLIDSIDHPKPEHTGPGSTGVGPK